MEKVLSFLLEYWRELVSVLSIILTCCLFLKKRGKVNPVIPTILEAIPSVLLEVEEKFGSGNGSEKKRFAMSVISALYKKASGIELVEGSSMYKVFAEFVESVLSAPHKKEDK